MNNIHVPLTPKQITALTELFEAVEASNRAGSVAAIVAQIWKDGIAAKVIRNEECSALATALGGNAHHISHSASYRMERKP